MSLATQITLLAQAIGVDIKALHVKVGSLSALNTSDKSSIVNAINEVEGEISSLNSLVSGLIDDAAIAGNTDHTWSADKILSYTAQLRSDIMGGIPSASRRQRWIPSMNWPSRLNPMERPSVIS